jgi:enterochelin esterase-like enzyme
MSDIWTRMHEIHKARLDKQRELMDEYNKTVYLPAIKQLQEDCVKEHGDHEKTKYHSNGWGWEWWYCGRCGAAHDKVQYKQ